jgi:hypothetical protein
MFRGQAEMNAIMTNFESESGRGAAELRKWEGLSEIDQAIRDNRLMEYRIKKSWADPWSRVLTVASPPFSRGLRLALCSIGMP